MDKREEAKLLALETLKTSLPPTLFLEPIEYVLADHFRQRMLCWVLDDIADAQSTDIDLLVAALDFLQTEFAPHVSDEEEDMFPLLLQRAEPEDEINSVLDRLSQEHASDETDARQIINILEALRQSDDVRITNADDIALLKRFATNERQHLIIENAIVLPLARVRLSEEDQQKLSIRMAARRGLDLTKVKS